MRIKEVETIWKSLEDIPFDENDDGELILAQDFYIFEIGTPLLYIWGWFDEKHPKGVAYLLGYEGNIQN